MGPAEVVASGIVFPEGLAWDAATATLLVSSVQEGRLYRVDPSSSAMTVVAELGGGANNVAVAEAGAVVCQNGGIDGHSTIRAAYPDLPDWPSVGSATPGIVLVRADGSWDYLLRDGVDAPNDVIVAADGSLYFTDPGNPFLPGPRNPCVKRLDPAGVLTVAAAGFEYCNGIELDIDGSVLVTDHGGIARIHPDGEWTWIVRGGTTSMPDGLAVDATGRIYLATSRESGVRVFEDGRPIEFISLPQNGSVSNCCFGGADLDWLFMTDVRRSQVLVVTDMPSPGRASASKVVAGAERANECCESD